MHNLMIYKRTEALFGPTIFLGLQIEGMTRNVIAMKFIYLKLLSISECVSRFISYDLSTTVEIIYQI